MARPAKPQLWAIVPEGGRIGRRHNITDLICRSTTTMANLDERGADDLAEGIRTAVRPFLVSRGIEVEVYEVDIDADHPTRELRAIVYAGMRAVAELTLTEVPES